MPPEISAGADDHIRLRVGGSTVSGLVGLRQQKSNIAVDIAMFTPSEDQVDFFGGGGVEIDTKTRWVVGARYFVVPDTKDLFGALQYQGLCCMNRVYGVKTRQAFQLDWAVITWQKHAASFPKACDEQRIESLFLGQEKNDLSCQKLGGV